MSSLSSGTPDTTKDLASDSAQETSPSKKSPVAIVVPLLVNLIASSSTDKAKLIEELTAILEYWETESLEDLGLFNAENLRDAIKNKLAAPGPMSSPTLFNRFRMILEYLRMGLPLEPVVNMNDIITRVNTATRASATPPPSSISPKEICLLGIGEFFSPWPDVWEVETVPKNKCKGAFQTVCRPAGFADHIPKYKDNILGLSESEKRNASNETMVESHGLPPKVTEKERTNKDKLARYASSVSSNSSESSNEQRKNSRNLIGGSVTSSRSGRNSGKTSPSLSGNSNASSLSQSKRYPDFGGRIPSTRAHMIPDPNSTKCYRYYNVICQAVLGFYQEGTSKDVKRLERIAKGLAKSDYNFLRASQNHGDYLDKKPCWILVPACTLQKILDWKPGDEAYPVLAVACGCGGTKVEEAYQMMCQSGYNDEGFEDNYGTEAGIGHLKRSKCKEKEFDEATQNLRQMTLAMAETLVGQGFKVRPDEILRGKLDDIDDDARNYIIKKLESKTADKEKGDEKSTGEEERDYYEPSEHLQASVYYDAVQFEQTRKSLMKDGIKLPKANEELDLDRCELLQVDVDPKRGLDLYPDPMLLLIKAAVNWSWWCGQKLLPACGCANKEEEKLVAPSTPVPATIEFKPAPVTPDDDDDVSV